MTNQLHPFLRFDFNNGSFLVQVPDEKAIQQAYAKTSEKGIVSEFPFWARIWPSAHAMVSFLDRHPFLYQDRRVVEIAAGLGLPALFTALGAKKVIASDYQAKALACMKASIVANGYNNMEALHYNWMEGLPEWETDVLLLSDTNYAPADLMAVEQLIHWYLKNGSLVVLTTPHRLAAREMLADLAVFCQYTELLDQKGQSITVYVYAADNCPLQSFTFQEPVQ
ncbi:class I SAM-dependent methyltransferase [Flavihumibacter sp. UBA7668]|uniref:class I SAM-dependent methyltransferase n=1 Tax=Flavihumibacter sp. UBA7668 TaxID=1946542 RepID=UPI0025C1E978|nr:hypothetical protein [Flavihumibacter sp. UBA7668]